MFGNFISDFLRGKEADKFSAEITLGIQLHRVIDTYTDRHPMVAQSKKRLWDKYRHYSAVIVDIFFDHYLAKNWNLYSDEPLRDFAQRSYASLADFTPLFPPKVKQVFPYMVRQNWLLNYGTLDGMRQAMNGVSRRASFPSKMEQATEDLIWYYDDFDNDFQAFFPEVMELSHQFLKEQGHSKKR